MQAEGIRQGQVSQVRGFADRQLRLSQKPEDPSNRRISIIVQHMLDDNRQTVKRDGT
jgi:chemotaxis protein MotB